EAAEDGIGDAGHGCKHGGGSDAEIADAERTGEGMLDGLADVLSGWRVRAARIVPELLHSLILLSFPGENSARRFQKAKPPAREAFENARFCAELTSWRRLR